MKIVKKERFRDTWKMITFAGQEGLVICGFMFGLNVYNHHNISYDAGYAKIYEKVDGVFSYTRFEKSNRSKELDLIKQNVFVNRARYVDYNNDGLVDYMHKPCIRVPQYLGVHRDSINADLFQKADDLFTKEKERFGLK